MPEEAKIGTWFEADITVKYDYSASAQNDDLSLTIDYVQIGEIAEEEIKRRAKLIETVIKRIADRLRSELQGLDGFSIKLKKYNPPINGEVDYVAVIWEE